MMMRLMAPLNQELEVSMNDKNEIDCDDEPN